MSAREETRETKNEDERKRGERFNRACILVVLVTGRISIVVGSGSPRNTDSHGCSSNEIRREDEG